MNCLTWSMLYDMTFLFVKSREGRSHDLCKPISSGERSHGWLAAKLQQSKRRFEMYKESLIQEHFKDNYNNIQCCALFFLHGHLAYSIIGKQYMSALLCGWLLAGGLEVITRGSGPASFTFSSTNWAVCCLRRPESIQFSLKEELYTKTYKHIWKVIGKPWAKTQHKGNN